jgi:hypothetical protein
LLFFCDYLQAVAWTLLHHRRCHPANVHEPAAATAAQQQQQQQQRHLLLEVVPLHCGS